MDGNEDSAKFANLLDQVKRLSELQKSGGLEGIDKEAYLAQLKRKADGIRDILSQLQLQHHLNNSSTVQPQATASSCEIYQNLGPLMGSGLLLKNAPTLPPKNSGEYLMLMLHWKLHFYKLRKCKNPWETYASHAIDQQDQPLNRVDQFLEVPRPSTFK